MKKAKSRRTNVAAKRKAPPENAPKNIDEYLAGVPEPACAKLNEMRAAIRSAAPPGAIEIISYRMPAIRYNGVLVWFGAFSGHCSLFPTASMIEAFKEELKAFTVSKGTIQFPLNKPLPIALIKKIVKARVKQVQDKKRRD